MTALHRRSRWISVKVLTRVAKVQPNPISCCMDLRAYESLYLSPERALEALSGLRYWAFSGTTLGEQAGKGRYFQPMAIWFLIDRDLYMSNTRARFLFFPFWKRYIYLFRENSSSEVNNIDAITFFIDHLLRCVTIMKGVQFLLLPGYSSASCAHCSALCPTLLHDMSGPWAL